MSSVGAPSIAITFEKITPTRVMVEMCWGVHKRRGERQTTKTIRSTGNASISAISVIVACSRSPPRHRERPEGRFHAKSSDCQLTYPLLHFPSTPKATCTETLSSPYRRESSGVELPLKACKLLLSSCGYEVFILLRMESACGCMMDSLEVSGEVRLRQW